MTFVSGCGNKPTYTNEIRIYEGKVYQSGTIMKYSLYAAHLVPIGDVAEGGIWFPIKIWKSLPLSNRP